MCLFYAHLSYFGIFPPRADATPLPQTPIPNSPWLPPPERCRDCSPSIFSQQSWAVCAEGGVPGLGNRFPQLCCPNLTLRNSSPLREGEADRPTDGCRRGGRIDWLLPRAEELIQSRSPELSISVSLPPSCPPLSFPALLPPKLCSGLFKQ